MVKPTWYFFIHNRPTMLGMCFTRFKISWWRIIFSWFGISHIMLISDTKKTSSTTTQVWQDSNSYDEYKCWIYFWNVIVNQMTCDRWFSKNLHQQKLCLFYGLTFRVIIRRSIFKMESVLWWLNINITFYVVQLSIDNIIFYRNTYWFYLSFICI